MFSRCGIAIFFGALIANTTQTLAQISSAVIVQDAQFAGATPPSPVKPFDISDSDYPLESLLAEEEGKTTLHVIVDAEGKVLAATMLRGSGNPRLDQAAELLARRWTFLPAIRNEQKVVGSVDVEVTWKPPLKLADEYRSDIPDMAILPPTGVIDFKPPVPLSSHAMRPSDYPLGAIEAGQRGVAQVKYLVLQDGTVGEARIEGSTGFPVLDASAVKMPKKWIFKPAILNGKPVTTWLRVDIAFILGGVDRLPPCRPEPMLGESMRMTPKEASIKVGRWVHITANGTLDKILVLTDGGWMQLSDTLVKQASAAAHYPSAGAQRPPSCWLNGDITAKLK